ncbi:cell division protein ZapA [bacterium]|nr:cell division protein ZapA [bacterium]
MEEEDKKVIKVIIHGREYPIRSDEDEEYVQKVASYVDSKMKEIADSNRPFPSPVAIAVLAALNIADELLKIDNTQSTVPIEFEHEIDALSERLMDVLEE